MASMAAEPPSLAAASNAVPRTVITLMASLLCTVAIMLPAYTGRSKVSPLITALMSEIACTSSIAATRGKIFFAVVVAVPSMCE